MRRALFKPDDFRRHSLPALPRLAHLIGGGSAAIPEAILAAIFGPSATGERVHRFDDVVVEVALAGDVWSISRHSEDGVETRMEGEGIAALLQVMFGASPGQQLALIAEAIGVDLAMADRRAPADQIGTAAPGQKGLRR
jgi:hypothetical protein